MDRTLSFEQLKELIELATNHDFFDYFSVGLSSVVPLFAIYISFLIFKKRITQVAQEKVIEKDIEKFYEIIECFFEYADTANLYFSLQIKSLDRVIHDKKFEQGFSDKLNNSTNIFFSKFEKVRRASFLLRALGEIALSEELDEYREKTIKLRKDILDIITNYEEGDDTELLGEFQKELKQRKQSLEIVKNFCLENLAQCKKRLRDLKSIEN